MICLKIVILENINMKCSNFQKIPKSVFKDAWGYTIDWLNPEDGWTDTRQQLMHIIKKRTMVQNKLMPAFTKYGFMKMKIPLQLYEMIHQIKSNSSMYSENCKVEWPMHNCVRVKEDGSKGTEFL